MRKILKYLFWKTVYCFRPRPKTFNGVMLKMTRCWSPWWKFKPHCFHNDDGGYWEVWFENDSGYSERRTINVSAHISRETGRVVGVQIYDEDLCCKLREPRIVDDPRD